MSQRRSEQWEDQPIPPMLPPQQVGMQPKASFFLGLMSGVAVMSLVGFVVVTTLYVQNGGTPASAKNSGTVAGAAVNSAAQPSPTANPDAIRAVSNDDHAIGAKNAKVTMIEYSDLQCPFCSRVHPTIQQLMKDYEGKIQWVFRHFPLESIHPQARPAAIASECIAELGGNDDFWKFTDAMMADQSKMSASYYEQLAGEYGIDVNKFKTCLTDPDTAAKVNRDAAEAQAAGAQGTPATFINGTLVSGAVPIDQFKSIIDQILEN